MIYTFFFLIGSMIGFLLGFTLTKRNKIFRELQEKLFAKEAEFACYQDQVAEHFEKTADLFAELQVRQDNLALHFQEGSKRLRGGMIDTRDYDAIAIQGYQEEAPPRDYPVGLSG